jgi:hypothetical protein
MRTRCAGAAVTKKVMPVINPTPKIVSASVAFAVLAWLLLLLGLMYARFVVIEPPPNVVITFSHKGLARLFTEVIGLGIGGLGVFLSGIAFARGARSRALTLAGLSNVSICIVCAALLM